MYRRYLTGDLATALGCCYAPVDDGSGGGEPAAPASADGDADPAADGGADGDPGADSDDDDDLDPGQLGGDDIDALPERNVRTKLRRATKHLSKARPIADRFRGPNGRFLPPEEIDGIISDSRQFRSMDQVFARSPRALEVFLEEQRRLERGADPADTTAAADDQFEKLYDEKTWPYETETASGKALMKMAQTLDEERVRTRRLEKQLGNVETGRRTDSEAQIEERFKTTTLAAAANVPVAIRQGFVDLVYERFLNLKSTGKLGKAKVEEVIQRSLASFGVKPTTKAPAARTPATIRASATAAGNTGLPRVPRPGVVHPADKASQPKRRETIADARKTFFGRNDRPVPYTSR